MATKPKSLSKKALQRKRRDQIIEKLRDGAELDAEGIEAIAESINDVFARLANRWSKKYFTAASIEIARTGEDPADTWVHTLAFRRQDAGWGFTIEEEHLLDTDGESWTSKPVASAPLEWRIRSIRLLPQLEKRLDAARTEQRDELLEAYDLLREIFDGAKE